MTMTTSNSSIHHVEIGITGGYQTVKKFLSEYPFQLIAKRCGVAVTQWIVSRSNQHLRFIFTDIHCPEKIDQDPYSVSWKRFQTERDLQNGHNNDILSTESLKYTILPNNSVFNIALEVKDIKSFSHTLASNGVEILKECKTMSDENGHIDVCVVKSVVGNVTHTLINSENYHGLFLPGFHSFCDPDTVYSKTDEDDITHIDHVTIACEVGSSSKIINWYETHFSMKRFFVHREEDDLEGFVISGKDIGLRLKALEYWKCAELGIESGADCPVESFKIVVAEALPGQGANQIESFLASHGGPGIQHIGLHTSDMASTVHRLKLRGVEFAEPPLTYYTEAGRLHDIINVGLDVLKLRSLGILIDTEEDDSSNSRYLLQKFTQPLFGQGTFFLEIIQRIGATGFGSGNITALWRSVQAYMNESSLSNCS